MLPTTYKYEVYRPDGTYLGILPNVASQFNYSQDINTPGSQIVVTVAQDIDNASQTVSYLTDETGQHITDESGNRITLTRQPDLYGSINNQALIQNGNKVKIYEYSPSHINGIKVFDGIIKRWEAKIGTVDTVELTVLSNGVELDNNILFGTDAIDKIQSTVTDGGNAGVSNSPTVKRAQVFTAGQSVYAISGVVIQAACVTTAASSVTLNVDLYSYAGGNPDSGTNLGSTTASISAIPFGVPSLRAYEIKFASPLAILPRRSYALVFSAPSAPGSAIIQMGQSTENFGSFDSAWVYSGGTWTELQQNSLYLITLVPNSTLQYTNCIYVNADPASNVTDFMTNYANGGGSISLGTVTPTGTQLTRSYILNTVQEGMTASLADAPAGYYWYVDVGSNQLNFKPASSTPDHMFIFKVHINEFDLLATSENSKNNVYITAGSDLNGNTIMARNFNAAAEARFGPVLDRITDSRLIDQGSAQIVVNNFVQENAVEQFQSTITIFATTYDITVLKLGDMVGFQGFGSFADSLTMQIVRVTRYPDRITLELGTLPRRATDYAETLKRSLISSQTVNNPLSAG